MAYYRFASNLTSIVAVSLTHSLTHSPSFFFLFLWCHSRLSSSLSAQVAWAEKAGIGVLVLSWYPPGKVTNFDSLPA